MFLNQLSYQEKKMFLDLSIHIAKANDVLEAEEKALISEYCTEMQLPPIEMYETEPLETVASYFALADEHIKKIVVLEILGLACIDGTYDDVEEAAVKRFSDAIGVPADVYDTLFDAIKDYYVVCRKLGDVIK